VARLREQFGDRVRVQEANFFAWEGAYDLILEQTFFCALPPDRRPAYVRHMHRLLKPGGRLVGVLFDREFGTAGPPFGGSRAEYETLFVPFFTPRVLAPCYNSAPPRRGTEVFISLEKPT
jgi:SAM-dependent methyltransferase